MGTVVGIRLANGKRDWTFFPCNRGKYDPLRGRVNFVALAWNNWSYGKIW